MAIAVKASKTTLITLCGVGPYVAATVKGEVEDLTGFASRDLLSVPGEGAECQTRGKGIDAHPIRLKARVDDSYAS